MNKEELKLPKEIVESLQDAMYKDVPKNVFSSVMSKIEKEKMAIAYTPESLLPIFIGVAVMLVGLLFLIPAQLLEKYHLPKFHITEFALPQISPVFWWSLLAVSLVLYADVFITKIKRSHLK